VQEDAKDMKQEPHVNVILNADNIMIVAMTFAEHVLICHGVEQQLQQLPQFLDQPQPLQQQFQFKDHVQEDAKDMNQEHLVNVILNADKIMIVAMTFAEHVLICHGAEQLQLQQLPQFLEQLQPQPPQFQFKDHVQEDVEDMKQEHLVNVILNADNIMIVAMTFAEHVLICHGVEQQLQQLPQQL
jgi:2-keto-4-pentenoate hydratase/2-oxohepta-3-ene-1,7-dioic acid hydratase in catechol pathway